MIINLIYNSQIVSGGEIVSLGDQSLIQGGSFTLTLLYGGDYSLFAPKGEIRDNYLEEEGTLIASFSFLPLTYDPLEDKTTVTFYILAGTTKDIPYTKYQGSGSPTVRTAYLYDIELIDNNDPNNVIKLVQPSYVQVKPEVTD